MRKILIYKWALFLSAIVFLILFNSCSESEPNLDGTWMGNKLETGSNLDPMVEPLNHILTFENETVEWKKFRIFDKRSNQIGTFKIVNNQLFMFMDTFNILNSNPNEIILQRRDERLFFTKLDPKTTSQSLQLEFPSLYLHTRKNQIDTLMFTDENSLVTFKTGNYIDNHPSGWYTFTFRDLNFLRIVGNGYPTFLIDSCGIDGTIRLKSFFNEDNWEMSELQKIPFHAHGTNQSDREILMGNWVDDESNSKFATKVYINKDFRIVTDTMDETFDYLLNEENHSFVLLPNTRQCELWNSISSFSFDYSYKDGKLYLDYERDYRFSVIPKRLSRISD